MSRPLSPLYALPAAVIGVCIVCTVLYVSGADYDKGYRQGQIDALTGTVKYELVTQADSTKMWQEVSDGQAQ